MCLVWGIWVYIFSAIALFVLIIACINFMNLTTARSTDRAREVGLRKVSGAHKTALLNPSGLPSTRGISRDSAVSSFASRMTTTA